MLNFSLYIQFNIEWYRLRMCDVKYYFNLLRPQDEQEIALLVGAMRPRS